MTYGPRVAEAFRLANELHQHQQRKGLGVPYLTHLMAVAALVGEAGGDEDAVIGALLHDAAEDQGGRETLARIEAHFGAEVAAIVLGCSDTLETPKPPWRPRKQAFIDRLRDESDAVRLVVCADKLHNARSLVLDLQRRGSDIWALFQGGRDGSLWYYDAVFRVLTPDGAPRLLLAQLESALTRIVDLA